MAEIERGEETDGLSAPAVAAEEYDAAYYLESCAGAEEWSSSEGADVAPLYPVSLERARFRRGEVLVDVGTGRGELLAVAVEKGAERAIGIEYSAAAVELAQRTIEQHAAGERAEVLLADARRLPVDDDVADLVTMLDVVEHLIPEELDRALLEARRVLRPGGRLMIHTFPSRTVYEITYRLQRLSRPSRWRSWPRNPRNETELKMHVNEQTIGSLRRSLERAGFADPDVTTGQWIHTTFLPDERARRTYHRLAARRLTKRLGAADIWADAVAPK